MTPPQTPAVGLRSNFKTALCLQDQESPSSGGNATLMSECDSPGTQGTDREGQAGEMGSFRDDDSSQMTNGDRSLNASTSSFQVALASLPQRVKSSLPPLPQSLLALLSCF